LGIDYRITKPLKFGSSGLPSAVKAGIYYFIIVFGAGFLMGALRVLVVAPAIGELGAVIAELPILLILSWIVCGFLVKRHSVKSTVSERVAMGGIAFLLLMLCEPTFAIFAFNRTAIEYFSQFRSLSGLVGLLGQVAFSTIPVLQLRVRS
jgi:hypothetical protein